MSEEIRCPVCDCPRVLAFQQAAVEPYGSDYNAVQLFFVSPLLRCLRCGEVWSDHAGEAAREEALARYRRVLCGSPNVRDWIERVKDRALAHVPPGVIDEVVKSWELYRLTMVEAGTGIEPVRSGI